MNEAQMVTMLSSENMGWRTPTDLLTSVREVFGGSIGLDPATTADNPTQAGGVFTPAEDGLLLTWIGHGSVFCNPPYGRGLLAWADKFHLEGAKHGVELITLTPARTDTKWWRRMMTSANAVSFLSRRLVFLEQRADGTWGPTLDRKGRPSPAPFPCAVTYWGEKVEDFVRVFGAQGWTIRL